MNSRKLMSKKWFLPELYYIRLMCWLNIMMPLYILFVVLFVFNMILFLLICEVAFKMMLDKKKYFKDVCMYACVHTHKYTMLAIQTMVCYLKLY